PAWLHGIRHGGISSASVSLHCPASVVGGVVFSDTHLRPAHFRFTGLGGPHIFFPARVHLFRWGLNPFRRSKKPQAQCASGGGVGVHFYWAIQRTPGLPCAATLARLHNTEKSRNCLHGRRPHGRGTAALHCLWTCAVGFQLCLWLGRTRR